MTLRLAILLAEAKGARPFPADGAHEGDRPPIALRLPAGTARVGRRPIDPGSGADMPGRATAAGAREQEG